MKIRSRLNIKSGIDMAPMVDIVFLLVTYFLINSTLAKNPAIKIELPKSVSAQSEVQKKIVIYVDSSNNIYLNEQKLTLEELPVELKKIAQSTNEPQVVIKGDKDSNYQTIVSVMDYVNQAGISHFNLATER